MLKIKKKRTGTTMTVILEGSVNSETAPKLYDEVKDKLEGLTELAIDMRQVDYVSSAGLRVFVIMYKTMRSYGGTMKLCHAKDFVKDLFVTTGFAVYMTFED